MYQYIDEDGHAYVTVVCSHCGHFAKVPVYCGNRFCPVCSIRRLNRVRKRLEFLLENRPKLPGYILKHLTLTIRNEDNLDQMIKNLLASFRRLRNRAYWKNQVSGGAFVVEVTNNGNGWHAHVHAIILSRRLDWHRIRDLWVKCSRGSTGVYIQNCSGQAAISYVTKYLSKIDASDIHRAQASSALKGTRLFSPFGSFYHINKTYKPAPHACPECKAIHSYLPWDILFNDAEFRERGWNP